MSDLLPPPSSSSSSSPMEEIDPDAARLLRKLRRLNARSEATRLAHEAETATRAERFAFVALHAENAVRAAHDTHSLAAATDTRDAALLNLRLAEAELAPDAARVAAVKALKAAALLPRAPSPDIAERMLEASRHATLRAALHSTRNGQPSYHFNHTDRFKAEQPSRWLLERVPAGTGAIDWSLIQKTHSDPGLGPAWRVVGHSGEATELRPHLIKAKTHKGSWPGHTDIDIGGVLPAGNLTTARSGAAFETDTDSGNTNANANATTTARSGAFMTTASRGRFSHDPIPSHTVHSTINQKTQTSVPQTLLKTLTRAQAMAPRHPAYLLDSRVRHSTGWHVAPSFPSGGAPLFSKPMAMAPSNPRERDAALVAMVPDRSLPFSDPITTAGGVGFYSDVHPPKFFSKVQLDYAWLREKKEEEEAEVERRFWLAAEQSALPFVRDHDVGGAALPYDATFAASRVDENDEINAAALARTQINALSGRGTNAGAAISQRLQNNSNRSKSGGGEHMMMSMRRANPDGTASPRTFQSSARNAYNTSLLGNTISSNVSGSGSGSGNGGSARALTLLTSHNGRFAPLRSALVFSTAEGAASYEEARAAVSACMPTGTRAFEKARMEANAQLDAQEERLERRGVSTGLGATGRHAASKRIHDLKAARRSLEVEL